MSLANYATGNGSYYGAGQSSVGSAYAGNGTANNLYRSAVNAASNYDQYADATDDDYTFGDGSDYQNGDDGMGYDNNGYASQYNGTNAPSYQQQPQYSSANGSASQYSGSNGSSYQQQPQYSSTNGSSYQQQQQPQYGDLSYGDNTGYYGQQSQYGGTANGSYNGTTNGSYIQQPQYGTSGSSSGYGQQSTSGSSRSRSRSTAQQQQPQYAQSNSRSGRGSSRGASNGGSSSYSNGASASYNNNGQSNMMGSQSQPNTYGQLFNTNYATQYRYNGNGRTQNAARMATGSRSGSNYAGSTGRGSRFNNGSGQYGTY